MNMKKAVVRGEAEIPGIEKRYGAIAKIKEMLKTGDRLRLLTPESGYDTGAKNTVTEGVVCEVYEHHFIVDNGKWKESVTWANLIKENLKAWINGKRLVFWDH
jgi:uncharacterized protein Veg